MVGEGSDGGMEGWREEGWRDGGMEGWRDGGMEGWRDGGMEGWRDGGTEGRGGEWKREDSPSKVACHPKAVRISPEEAKLRHLPKNADPELPKGYIVVEENDFVSVKYVLLYKNFGVFTETGKKTNICKILAIIYVFVLIGLWMMRSPGMRHYYARYLEEP
jgi:hypothetical protein